MTAEQRWLSSTCLWDMGKNLQNQPGSNKRQRWRRKWRLWGIACCRLHPEALADERARRGLDVAERLAEGRVAASEVTAARQAVQAVRRERRAAMKYDPLTEYTPTPDPLWAIDLLLDSSWGNFACAARTAAHGGHVIDEPREEDRPYADLCREVFGNPFRLAKIERAWLTWNGGAVKSLAQTIYDERTFAQLPVLADALEDAGCRNESILAHCRGEGPHVRGCWVVDLVLGKW
jgi:hypothetical protein